MRFKVMFENEEALDAALAAEDASGLVQVVNRERQVISVEAPPRMTQSAFSGHVENLERCFGCRIEPEEQYDLEAGSDRLFTAIDAPPSASLEEVLDQIGARDAWRRTRGADIDIAIVDTGIDGSRPEFPADKRVGDWTPKDAAPWTDWQGHGTMCACIAAGTKAKGGVFDGVAPEAGLIACRTQFYEVELAAVFDMLRARVQAGRRVIASNSWGRSTGTPPAPPKPDNLFVRALDDAIAAGLLVVCSAGNNHDDAGGLPSACAPNSIWLHKSRADLMAVATCDLDGAMWDYSSRGPGQHFGDPDTNRKPDVTAPTPRNGRIVYGRDVVVLPNGWGTSGACPQVAGLAALLWSLDPTLARDRLFAYIHSTAVDLGLAAECQGHGRIDCGAAVDQLAGSRVA